MRFRHLAIAVFLLALGPLALAQSSASYTLTEQVFNQAGHPQDGTILGSTNFRMTLDSVGEGIVGRGMSSGSYRMDGSFLFGYPPPGEVLGLRLADHETLVWNPEISVGVYNLYRGDLSGLAGLGYGSCEQQDLDQETTTDPETPPLEDGFFYLVTAENRLSEEGTKGRDSEGDHRPNPNPCP